MRVKTATLQTSWAKSLSWINKSGKPATLSSETTWAKMSKAWTRDHVYGLLDPTLTTLSGEPRFLLWDMRTLSPSIISLGGQRNLKLLDSFAATAERHVVDLEQARAGKTSPWFCEKSSATLVDCLQPKWAKRVCFQERHLTTAPSVLKVKEISNRTRRNGSNKFSLLTVLTKNSRQCPFLVIGTCRTLRDTLKYLQFHAVYTTKKGITDTHPFLHDNSQLSAVLEVIGTLLCTWIPFTKLQWKQTNKEI